ncbi:HAD hydrolase-like protein [Streptomyces sp. L7]
MIGDRSHDVVGARANGLTAIGVLYGYGSEGRTARCGRASHLHGASRAASAAAWPDPSGAGAFHRRQHPRFRMTVPIFEELLIRAAATVTS